jgi:chromosome segregation ATPase
LRSRSHGGNHTVTSTCTSTDACARTCVFSHTTQKQYMTSQHTNTQERTRPSSDEASSQKLKEQMDALQKELAQAKDRENLNKAKLEQLTKDVEAAVKRHEAVARERDAAVQEREVLKKERDALVKEREAAAKEKETVVKERESAVKEKDGYARDKEALVQQRDAALRERDEAVTQLAAYKHESDSKGDSSKQRDGNMEAQLQGAQEQCTKLQSECAHLRSECEELKQKVAERDARKADESKQAEDERARLKDRIRELEKDADVHRRKTPGGGEEVSELKAQLKAEQAEKEVLAARKRELEVSVAALREDAERQARQAKEGASANGRSTEAARPRDPSTHMTPNRSDSYGNAGYGSNAGNGSNGLHNGGYNGGNNGYKGSPLKALQARNSLGAPLSPAAHLFMAGA